MATSPGGSEPLNRRGDGRIRGLAILGPAADVVRVGHRERAEEGDERLHGNPWLDLLKPPRAGAASRSIDLKRKPYATGTHPSRIRIRVEARWHTACCNCRRTDHLRFPLTSSRPTGRCLEAVRYRDVDGAATGDGNPCGGEKRRSVGGTTQRRLATWRTRSGRRIA